ncbi:Chlorophyll synthase, chloroplastic [Galdieria sulphuraria]|uniref:Chlorophyll synthase n=1 Tax=Galdieria sulphuraria TaxID=130081 RepID=M2W2L3_GALSU|nr:chlorophyll synthase [Galdieria sulphuraria]EME29931.1 chlorophyll synthase [Galdieria sulphuraria]GJD11981.1 Chlorophyll synthase, chloroplastic [Galdieria sulphuraria]|eukprot:XP_005706451.1 chlorophyll synthase [Galdieria sulphuraria]
MQHQQPCRLFIFPTLLRCPNFCTQCRWKYVQKCSYTSLFKSKRTLWVSTRRSSPLVCSLKESPDKETEEQNKNAATQLSFRQLLGMKGASSEDNIPKWRIHLQLMKPVTWIPLIWGVICGAAASGNFEWNLDNISKAALCMLLSGPLLTGYTQTLNDYYDKDIDAINEPYRPIPSGAISEQAVKAQIIILLSGGLGLAFSLDKLQEHESPTLFFVALLGCFLAYIYSAPPLKLKRSGWIGNYALGASYISLPWWAGQSLFGTLDYKVMLLTLLYSLAGLGIAVVNDFKSVEGDRKLGLRSIPVEFGIEGAKWISVFLIDTFQALIAAVLFSIHETPYACGVVACILPQVYFQFRLFLKDPLKYDVQYQASAQPFLVVGILLTALAIGNHHGIL